MQNNSVIIEGQQPLSGTIPVSGSKNASLPILAACLLTEQPVVLRGLPRLTDVTTMCALLKYMGVGVARLRADGLLVQPPSQVNPEAPAELVSQMRASVCVLGPLLAKCGKASVALPGGCQIGSRPIDLHLRGLAALGANIQMEDGRILACARRLTGNTIDMSGPRGSTVTGTCNVLSAATLASGLTTITGAACEPEVVELGRFLNSLGARISGLGSSTIKVKGVSELRSSDYQIPPDRIEAATWIALGCLSRTPLRISPVPRDQLTAVIDTLRQIGATVDRLGPGVIVAGGKSLKPVEIEATSYPGIPTDLQAQLTTVLSFASGVSRISDRVFPSRFHHVSQLNQMGADISLSKGRAMVRGIESLRGAEVNATDLRASVALVIAALMAKGQTVIHGLHHLNRGYQDLTEKLNNVGARISLLDGVKARRAA